MLLCDGGARRNAAAEHVHNFVTRDGTPPAEFRRIGREQLAPYPSVEVRDVRIEGVFGARGAFRVRLPGAVVEARRLLLCTGLVDETLPIEGYRELCGRSIFQCPYCHGWEVRDRRWGYLARAEHGSHALPFVLMLRSWTEHVTLFTHGEVGLAEEVRRQLLAAGVRIDPGSIARLVARGGRLEAVELSGGARVPCEVLFAHPPQRQVELVRALGVELDEDGFVRIDPMRRETLIPGVFAAGDLATRMQAAVAAAASGMQAAVAINLDLALELGSS